MLRVALVHVVLLALVPALVLAHELHEGSKCETSLSGQAVQGVCKKLASCPRALEEARRGRPPTRCSFVGRFPIVCCPSRPINRDGGGNKTGTGAAEVETGERNQSPSGASGASGTVVNQTVGLIARQKCVDYAAFVFTEEDSQVWHAEKRRVDQCAISADPLIVGGSRAKSKEFPHMALVGFEVDSQILWGCGGSLISPDFVLTAGHCVYFRDIPTTWVLLGELDKSTSLDDASPQKMAVSDRIKHPRYQPPSRYDDIALLRLERPAEMNAYVRPGCLHMEPGIGSDQRDQPVATGWGLTEPGGDPSNHLLKVSLREVDPRQCAKAYLVDSKRKLPSGILTESQLCAGGVGKDTCQSDSGGPLQMVTRSASEPYCMYKIVGVTSFGSWQCGDGLPGVYSRVYHYVQWIEGVVWGGPGERQALSMKPAALQPDTDTRRESVSSDGDLVVFPKETTEVQRSSEDKSIGTIRSSA